MENLKLTARKFALQNAIRYEGKANAGKIIGRIISEHPEYKKETKMIMPVIKDIVDDVNSMAHEMQEEELKELAPELLEKKAEKKELKELNNVGKKVVMRFEPSPSGPLHIGHAYVLGLNHLYTKKYDGSLILRIADTNAGTIYKPSYDYIPDDGNWLTNKGITEIFEQSSRMEFYYAYALKLLERGGAYICTCSQEDFRKYSNKKIPCPCRDNKMEENIKLWHKMFDGFEQGEAVMRIKTDVKHKNPAMRDFPLFRINDDSHPKTKNRYRVWPLMNFSVFVDDHDKGLTHIIRAKDHADNAKRQEYLYKYFDLPIPETIFVGKINFIGLNLSCTKTKPLIEDGTYTGWDDIRLPFLPALRRRGYQPEALIHYAEEVGISLNDKTVTKDEFFKALNSFNKEMIEPTSSRYFFIKDPVEIKVKDAPSQELKLHFHPDKKDGGRKFSVKDRFYIAKEDMDKLEEGGLYRLMDCLNFRYENMEFIFDSADYKAYKNNGRFLMHWLPVADNLVESSVLNPDASTSEGLCESSIKDAAEGEIVQLERYGFCRLDKKTDKTLKFWFGHK